ncbi:MAG: family 16 glycosylhydrolase [Lacipirellulaceae bacterium]
MRFFACMFFLQFSVWNGVRAANWEQVSIPVAPSDHKAWELLPISDDFSYKAPPLEKPQAFTKRWKDTFINPWKGPGLTSFDPGHSYVLNGHLGIAASRKRDTNKVRAGAISSRETFRYPLYIEASVKLSGLVMASNVWMLSADSTQEIDVVEAYGSQRPTESWTSHRLHLSHHVFIRKPFKDYQPTDEGSWYYDGTNWQQNFHRVGVFWRDPWHLEYYVNGKKVRTVSGKEKIDPHNYTRGTGLSKPMHIIINTEDQDWRSDKGTTPTDKELADTNKSIYWVDWIRVYQLVDSK